jgi:hypothetical protein
MMYEYSSSGWLGLSILIFASFCDSFDVLVCTSKLPIYKMEPFINIFKYRLIQTFQLCNRSYTRYDYIFACNVTSNNTIQLLIFLEREVCIYILHIRASKFMSQSSRAARWSLSLG